MNRASRSLVLLLSLTVTLAGLLAYEAQRASRSHRVTAERALRDYATVAAQELATVSAEALEGLLAPALDPVIGSPAASPYDSLPPASSIAAGGGRHPRVRRDRCGSHLLRARLPERDSVHRRGSPRRRDGRLASGLDRPRASGRLAIAWGSGPTAGRIAVYGVKSLRYSGFAGHDAPLAAYGLVTCSSALGPVIARVLEEHPLLPRSVSGGLSNAELAAIEVAAPDGAPLFRFGPAAEAAYAGDTVTAGPGSPVFRAALPPAVAGRLVVARPRSRLPLLFGLLAVTAGLAAVALRQLRREQELARLRADFTSSVSHELRTPLTQILLFAETLELGRAGGRASAGRRSAIIVQEARRLAHLVENMLQFSRAERRMVRLRTAEQPLAPLVREIVERFAPLAAGGRAPRHRARRGARRPGPRRVTAPDRAQPAGQRGEVRRRRRGGLAPRLLAAGRARLEVDDAGPGIAPEDRPKVWEPYVRLERSPAVAGSGIGLAVVRELVAAHGGRAGSRTRRAAGRGSWWSCRTAGARHRPRRRDGARAHRRGQPQPGPRPAHQPGVRGPRGGVAGDGTAGLIRARTRSHDLIVLDLMLPGLDGFRVLETLRGEGVTTPVLVLTARGDETDKVRGLRGGADDYVTKPFALRELLARVTALLRRARAGSEERSAPAAGSASATSR